MSPDGLAPRARAADRLATVLVWSASASLAAGLLWVVGDVVASGVHGLSLDFLLEPPARAGRDGGISTILASTLALLAVCLGVAVPIGLGAGLFLAEYTGAEQLSGRLIRASLDVLAGVPSIVFGLFGNAFFCVFLGLGFSILSGGLTLACMVLPLVIRSVELGLRGVPDDYRAAGAALDLSRWRLIGAVLLPAAAPGLLAGVLLGVGRALAETAALVFTSGYVDRMPSSLLDSGRALSVHVFDLALNVPGGEDNAYTTALVLVLLLIVINLGSGWLVERFVARGVRA